MAAARRLFTNGVRVPINPPHVVDRSDDEAWLAAFVAITEDRALRSPVEQMLVSVGCGDHVDAVPRQGGMSKLQPGCTTAEAERFTPTLARFWACR